MRIFLLVWFVALLSISGCNTTSQSEVELRPVDSLAVGSFELGGSDVPSIQARASPKQQVRLTPDGPVYSYYEFSGRLFFERPAILEINVLNDSLVIRTAFTVSLSGFEKEENAAYLDAIADSLFSQVGFPDSSLVQDEWRHWSWTGQTRSLRVSGHAEIFLEISLESPKYDKLVNAGASYPTDSSSALSSYLDLRMTVEDFRKAGLNLEKSWYEYNVEADDFSQMLFGSRPDGLSKVRFWFVDKFPYPVSIMWHMTDLEPVIGWLERRFGSAGLVYEKLGESDFFRPKVIVSNKVMQVRSEWQGEYYLVQIFAQDP